MGFILEKITCSLIGSYNEDRIVKPHAWLPSLLDTSFGISDLFDDAKHTTHHEQVKKHNDFIPFVLLMEFRFGHQKPYQSIPKGLIITSHSTRILNYMSKAKKRQ